MIELLIVGDGPRDAATVPHLVGRASMRPSIESRGIANGRHRMTPVAGQEVHPELMSADAFARLYRSRTPLDADTAKEIAANLAATDRAK